MTQVVHPLPVLGVRTVSPVRKAPGRGFSSLNERLGNGNRKLTHNDIRAIRLAGEWGWPAPLVAKLYGLSKFYCWKVMRGETHPHVI